MVRVSKASSAMLLRRFDRGEVEVGYRSTSVVPGAGDGESVCQDQTPIVVQPALSQINKKDIVNTEIAVERTIAADACGTCTLYC